MNGLLAQVSPIATTDTLLYRSVTGATLGSVFVCNQTGGVLTFRMRVARSESATAATAEYLYYGTQVGANSTLKLDLGMSLDAGQALYVYASAINMSFNVFGAER